MKRLRSINILTFVFFVLLLSGCIEDRKLEPGVRGAGKPIFKEDGASVKSKTASTIEVTAEILKENGSKITERGFCYGTSPSPTVENGDTILDAEVGIGSYTLILKSLTHNTKYYIRPYAINEYGVEYGTPELSDSTRIGTGEVITIKRDVFASKATVGGQIGDFGEGEIIRRGVYYSRGMDFADKDSVESESTDDDGIYLCQITGLTPSETYYVQAFVVNTYDMFTGETDSILTRDGMPRVGKINSISPGFTDVTLTSSVTNDGDETVEIVERGFCWALTPDPTISGDTIHRGSGTGEFAAIVTELTPQELYYAQAYAISNYGKIHYSDQITFTTKKSVPTVQTGTVGEADMQNGNVNVGGVIEDEGMTRITAAGICWSSTNPLPTLVDSVLPLPFGTGVLSGTLTNLTGGVTYYIRAFATNADGTSYDVDAERFTTPPIFETNLKPFPGEPRLPGSSAYFAIDDNLYLLGGDLGPRSTNELWYYSIVDKDWHERQAFSGGAAKWQTGVRYGNGAYVYGGYDENAEVKTKPGLYYYNPNFNSWELRSQGADTLCMAAGCAKGNGIIYVGGKRDTVKQDVWLYDVGNYSWEKKTDFPVKQYGGMAVMLNDVIYAGMGRDDQEVCNGKLWITADFAATWTLKTSCSIYSGDILAGVANIRHQRIYVIDGDYYILEYNPVNDVWTRKSRLPSDYRSIHCMYDYNGKIYIGLGGSATNALIVYDPSWDN
ncbi:MAG: hypothetical protein LBJ47_00175 [Tannerella sp.]|jgi:hypothetical protein|nr:hypothetical protein [Tannerella sp.]